jgi:hypothetical protein
MYELPVLSEFLEGTKDANKQKRVRRKAADVLPVPSKVHHKGASSSGKRPAKTVGSGGKLRYGPSKRQAKFTVQGHAVIPVHSSDYIGYDKRTTLGPEEIADIKVNGYYAKDWQAKRAK